MLRHGTIRHKAIREDPSFHRTFPHFAAAAPAVLPNLTYSYDAGLTMPNQTQAEPPLTERAYDYGCTGFSTGDVTGNEDKNVYLPGYIYENTCLIENHPPESGCDMRNSMKAVTVYGLKKAGETDDAAVQRKRGQPYIVDKAPNRDWFDSFRIALRNNTRRTGISIGTMWFIEWTSGAVNYDGILTPHFIYDGDPNHYSWHDWVASGEKEIDGIPYLQVKSWQGKNIGDGGWLYMSREVFNKIYDVYGTIGLIPGLAVRPEDVKYVKYTLYQVVLDFLNRILRLKIANYA